ncbi:MAG: hypothetical protein AB1750_10155 [Chloroflexota bacterium]
MNKQARLLIMVGATLVLLAIALAACGVATAPPTALPTATAAPPTNIPDQSGAAAYAVDLIAAWVNAGAPETGAFDYEGVDGNTYQATFEVDILPLFTQNNVWFEGSQACAGCHFAASESSAHQLNLSNYEGIRAGADSLEEPPGVSILGESEPNTGDFDWDHSKLRERLRNNRMPPGWEFDVTEANRNGPCIEVATEGVTVKLGEYGCDSNAVGLLGAWVEAGAPDGEFTYGEATLTFERDVLPFFTKPSMWFEGSQACSGCHFAASDTSAHQMDLSTYEGILAGADTLEAPPGVSILGESEPGKGDYNWSDSKLRARLRNNRMAPGWEFDVTEGNRNGPLVLHGARVEKKAATPQFGAGECEVYAVKLIGAWVDAGALNGAFDFTSESGAACEGTFEADILPLFTQNNVWFEGSQACVGCHFAASESSAHQMNLSTYEGILLGADTLEAPPGVSILGQSEPNVGPFDWEHSKLRERLRNNRMPPGWEFDVTEANRNGPCVEVAPEGVTVKLGEYGCDLNAVGLIGAWVEAGAPNGEFAYGDATLNFERDILPFFTKNSMWFQGSQACSGCHFAASDASAHQMDLSSYAGILAGADTLEAPPGVSILGESAPGAGDFNWSASKLRARLRNNRMAPGWFFDVTEGNRNGPLVLAGTKK